MKQSKMLVVIVCAVTAACNQDPARSVKIMERPSEPANAAAPSPAPEKAIEPSPQPAAVTPASPAPVKKGEGRPQPATATSTGRVPAKLAEQPAQPAGVNATVAAPVENIQHAPQPQTAIAASAVTEANWHPDSCPPPAEDSPGPSTLVVKGPCEYQHQGAIICESLGDDFIVAFTRKAQGGASVVTYLNVERYHGPGNYDGAQMFVAVQNRTSIYRWSSETVHATIGPNEAFVAIPTTRLEGEPMLAECTRLIGPATNYQYQCGATSSAAIALENTAQIVSGRLQCVNRKKK